MKRIFIVAFFMHVPGSLFGAAFGPEEEVTRSALADFVQNRKVQTEDAINSKDRPRRSKTAVLLLDAEANFYALNEGSSIASIAEAERYISQAKKTAADIGDINILAYLERTFPDAPENIKKLLSALIDNNATAAPQEQAIAITTPYDFALSRKLQTERVLQDKSRPKRSEINLLLIRAEEKFYAINEDSSPEDIAEAENYISQAKKMAADIGDINILAYLERAFPDAPENVKKQLSPLIDNSATAAPQEEAIAITTPYDFALSRKIQTERVLQDKSRPSVSEINLLLIGAEEKFYAINEGSSSEDIAEAENYISQAKQKAAEIGDINILAYLKRAFPDAPENIKKQLSPLIIDNNATAAPQEEAIAMTTPNEGTFNLNDEPIEIKNLADLVRSRKIQAETVFNDKENRPLIREVKGLLSRLINILFLYERINEGSSIEDIAWIEDNIALAKAGTKRSSKKAFEYLMKAFPEVPYSIKQSLPRTFDEEVTTY